MTICATSSTSPGISPEVALDFFRTEGGWEPQDPPPAGSPPSPASVGPPGRFVNQCGRCLEFKQAARKTLSGRQSVHLCAECAGPNPPEVIMPRKPSSIFDRIRQDREAVKAAEKEQRKREREEAKARRAALPRVRKPRNKAGVEADPVREGP